MNQQVRERAPSYNALMRYARALKFGKIHTKIDHETGLHAIIAIHNTQLGPAIGGCRFHEYDSPEYALKDALRLATGMTLKAAACGLAHGGAKAVIMKPKHITNRKALFEAFGDFINELNGAYITAVDVGSTPEDMTWIAERTPFVIGAQLPDRIDEDPSPSTATGVFRAIQAAVAHKFKQSDLTGIRVAIQGVGRVGYHLAKHLTAHNASVTITDKDQARLDACAAELPVTIVAPNEIVQVPCDIFSPCALGGSITAELIHRNKPAIIAGAANNQLSHRKNAKILQDAGVLYLPDFFINSGGLINAAMVYTYQDIAKANQKVDTIYQNTLDLLRRAEQTGKTTTHIAEEIAFERLTLNDSL